MIEYANRKAELAHCIVQIVDVNELDDRQEWCQEQQKIVRDPFLARVTRFYNIYHQIWATME